MALDDVGAAPASLAVRPFVRPDAVKLDMRLLQGRTTAEAAHIINTVRAHAERTNAVVIAEGIETIKHAREAMAAGATVGQGFLFGYPAPLPSAMPRRARPSRCGRRRPWPAPPPLGGGGGQPRAPPGHPGPAGRDVHAARAPGAGRGRANVLLACFQEAGHFAPATRSRYEFLATRAAFTGALGHGMPVAPVAGVRGADLADDDPLRRDWDLVVIGPGSPPPWSPGTATTAGRTPGAAST